MRKVAPSGGTIRIEYLGRTLAATYAPVKGEATPFAGGSIPASGAARPGRWCPERHTRQPALRWSDADLRQLTPAQSAIGTRLMVEPGENLLHACAHATHHRAQALNVLRHLVTTPPPLEFMVGLREYAALWAKTTCRPV